ncbi:snare region anchored in the vesicle membrane C-terminus-domain-containing protein, partial [Dimargaris cristalligena]
LAMNSTYNTAKKQLFLLQQDLTKYESGVDVTPALRAELETRLAGFHQSIQKYQSLSQKEFVVQRQQQAKERIRTFLDEYNNLSQRLEREKVKEQTKQTQTAHRQELMQRRPTDSNKVSFQRRLLYPIEMDYVHREQNSLQQSEGAIDGFIETAQAALSNLREQRGWLKNSRRKILDTANTLGLSRSVIHYIERRTTQDKWVFWTGVIATIGFIWFLIHFFR